MSSEFPGDQPPECRKAPKWPSERDSRLPVLCKLDECPPRPKPPSGTSGTSLQVISNDRGRSGIRLRSARLGKAGKPQQQANPGPQQVHFGPFLHLECRALPRNPLKTCYSKAILPVFHSKPPVIDPCTDHRPRASSNKPQLENLSECISRPEPPKSLCITPKEALELFRDKLTEFEQEEIKNFTQIYFLGLDAKKIKAVEGAPKNHGFDDDNGVYLKVLGDHIQYRYEVLELLGQGSFGQVLKCLDHKTKEQVAIKILCNCPRLHDQAQKELKILELLRKKDWCNDFNIIHVKEHFVFRNHICVTFELQGMNLFKAIRGNKQGFSQATVRHYTKAILRCLQVLRHEKIIHCDLKPENIVLSQADPTKIKVIDFGLSCHEDDRVFTYIQSRYYRAPEVILGNSYGMEIDMWSLGCIVAELFISRPIFPGENEKEQIALIMEVLGPPPVDIVMMARRRRKFFDANGNPKPYINSTRGITRKPWSKDLASVLKSSDPLLLDFVKRCLEWDPRKRMTPDEAMTHDWLVEAEKRCRTRICNWRVDTPPQSPTNSNSGPVKDQESNSASKTQHSTNQTIDVTSNPPKDAVLRSPQQTGVESPKLGVKGVTRSPEQAGMRSPLPGIAGSPKQAAEEPPMLHIPRPPKQAAVKIPKLRVKGDTMPVKQTSERSLKLGVAQSPKQTVLETPMLHVPRPPKQLAKRPVKLIRSHKLVIHAEATSTDQPTKTSLWHGGTKSHKPAAVMVSSKYGTANPRQCVPRPPPKQEAGPYPWDGVTNSSQKAAEKPINMVAQKSSCLLSYRHGLEMTKMQTSGRPRPTSPGHFSPPDMSAREDAEAAVTTAMAIPSKNVGVSGTKCMMTRRRPGRRIVILPAAEARTLPSDPDLNQGCRRLN